MDNIDASFLGAIQNTPHTDYVSMFAKGFNLASALPFSAENVRKRQMEDYALAMKQQQFQAQQAEQQQSLAIKQALLPYQMAHYQRMGATTPTTAGGLTPAMQERQRRFEEYTEALHDATIVPSPQGVPVPAPSPAAPPFANPDPPIF